MLPHKSSRLNRWIDFNGMWYGSWHLGLTFGLLLSDFVKRGIDFAAITNIQAKPWATASSYIKCSWEIYRCFKIPSILGVSTICNVNHQFSIRIFSFKISAAYNLYWKTIFYFGINNYFRSTNVKCNVKNALHGS